MKRHQLEHILRASAAITGADRFIIIGSQATLGQFSDAPEELLASMGADLFSLRSPEDANLIEGSIGEGSPFHQTFGYHAHGVDEETAVLPAGWKERLVPVAGENTGGATGLSLEVHDLAVSKLVAGREKDLTFVAGLIRHHLADTRVIRERIEITPLDETRRRLCLERLKRFSSNDPTV